MKQETRGKTVLADRDPKKEYKGGTTDRVVKSFEKHLKNLGYTRGTIRTARLCLMEFLQNNPDYKAATKTTIISHYKYLKERPNKTRPGNLDDNTVNMHMYSIRLFYDYLEQRGKISENPASQVNITKARSNERKTLSREEIQKLYRAADSFKGKAFLALFYGCGLRRAEAEKLNLEDINTEAGLLYVREGKGRKRRVVPMSEKVKTDLENYIQFERKYEVKYHYEESLMINQRGARMTKHSYYKFFKKLLIKAGLNTDKSLHNLRHTIATHLLESGLEIEQVRSFLGHEHLETTQIYTHVKWKH